MYQNQINKFKFIYSGVYNYVETSPHFILIFCNMIFFELIVKLCNLDINYSLDNAYVE